MQNILLQSSALDDARCKLGDISIQFPSNVPPTICPLAPFAHIAFCSIVGVIELTNQEKKLEFDGKAKPNYKESCTQEFSLRLMVQKLENVHFSIFGQLKFDIEVLKTLDKHLDKVRKIVVGYTYYIRCARTVQGALLACHGFLLL